MEHIIDAKNKKLGRLASEIAVILQGKNKPTFEKRLPGSEKVIVKNITLLDVSAKKFQKKVYYKHTTQIGHLKTTAFSQKFSEDPKWILRHAVSLMLPKNRLQKVRLKKLIIE